MRKGQGVNSATASHYPQGVEIVRLWDSGVRWSVVSSARGVYNFSRLDIYTAKAAATGTKLVYCVGDTPQFAIGTQVPPYAGAFSQWSNYIPNLTILAEFVTALVTHCELGGGANKLYAVEAWNEWNAGNFLDPRATPAQVTAIGKAVHDAVKAVNPNVLVTTPTVCRNKTSNAQAMDSILAVGAGAYADVVTFHGYIANGADPSTIAQQIDLIRTSMVTHGVPNLLLWDTESGWGANNTVPDAAKPAYINAWLNVRQQHGCDAAIWYQWDNTTHGTLWTAAGGVNPAGAAWIAWNSTTSGPPPPPPPSPGPGPSPGPSGWIDAGRVDVSSTSDYISGVTSGLTYNVRIRSVTATGATSVWVEADGVVASAPNSLQATYTNNPQFCLTQPTPTSVAIAAVAVTFGSHTVNYAARTLTIPTPSVPTWYYVTIADPTQAGEAGSATLTATAQISNALCGVTGNTFMGAILATPAGGPTRILAGGWPAPQTIQVG